MRWFRRRRYKSILAPADPATEPERHDAEVLDELMGTNRNAVGWARVIDGNTGAAALAFGSEEAAIETMHALRAERYAAEVTKDEEQFWNVLCEHPDAKTEAEWAAAKAHAEELAKAHGPAYHGFGNPPPDWNP